MTKRLAFIPNDGAEVRSIDGFPGYFVTSDGDVLSQHRGPMRRLKQVFNRYYVVSLKSGDAGQQTQFSVHVLICTAFHGARPDGLQCRHLDGNPKNNRATNLCWGTPTENNADRARHGTLPSGSKAPTAKLLEWEVSEILFYSSLGIRERVLAEAYSVSLGAIKHIRNGRSWRNVSQHDPELIDRERWPVANRRLR